MLVTGSFPPMRCGVGDYTEALARGLAGEAGVEVAVLTDRLAAERPPGEPYRVRAVLRRWRRRELGAVAAAVRELRPDIAHVQYPTLGYRGRLPWLLPRHLARMGLPVVQTWHEPFPVAERPGWRDLALAATRGGVVVVRPDHRAATPWWYRLLTRHKEFELIPNAAVLPALRLAPRERAEIRARHAAPEQTLLAFFGFLYEHKGIDDLIAALDPARHVLLLVGPPRPEDPYQARLLERIAREPLARCVRVMGFLPADEAARVLAAADAVVLPFRRGAGVWNTSLHAAALQGTFTLTTSLERHGYDPETNVCRVPPRDPAALRRALDTHAGRRRDASAPAPPTTTWPEIVERHLAFYRRHLRRAT